MRIIFSQCIPIFFIENSPIIIPSAKETNQQGLKHEPRYKHNQFCPASYIFINLASWLDRLDCRRGKWRRSMGWDKSKAA